MVDDIQKDMITSSGPLKVSLCIHMTTSLWNNISNHIFIYLLYKEPEIAQ